MYKGYRIKINGTIVSNNFIALGSYSSKKEEKVLYEYYDADGERHEELSGHKITKIAFTIRKRNMKEQELIGDIFQETDNVQVEYYDEKSRDYKTGIFKIEEPEYKHRNTINGTINYDETRIVMEEY